MFNFGEKAPIHQRNFVALKKKKEQTKGKGAVGSVIG